MFILDFFCTVMEQIDTTTEKNVHFSFGSAKLVFN